MPATVNPHSFVSHIEKLPPINAIVARVLEVTNSKNASASDVARILSTDPAIVAKVLRIANSPFYGIGRKVTQITRAVVMLGSVAVRNLVTAICAKDALTPSGRFAPERMLVWHHSIAVASACDLIARRIGYQPPEEAFLGGLLHDIGQLAMATFVPEAFRAAFQDQTKGVRFLAREKLHLGIDHVEAGHRILNRWHLPDILCRIVHDHHKPEIAEKESHARLLAVVMLGDIFAQMEGIGLDVSPGTSHRAIVAAAALKLSDSDQLQILDKLTTRIQQALDMFTDIDLAQPVAEEVPATRALWLSADSESTSYNAGQLLLEHRGYEVQRVTETTLAADVKAEDMVLIDLHDAGAARIGSLSVRLQLQGVRRVVILNEPGEEAAVRSHDPATGVCCLPRLFTVFDIRWLEARWQQ